MLRTDFQGARFEDDAEPSSHFQRNESLTAPGPESVESKKDLSANLSLGEGFMSSAVLHNTKNKADQVPNRPMATDFAVRSPDDAQHATQACSRR